MPGRGRVTSSSERSRRDLWQVISLFVAVLKSAEVAEELGGSIGDGDSLAGFPSSQKPSGMSTGVYPGIMLQT